MKNSLSSMAVITFAFACQAQTNAPAIAFEPLPYVYDALEPHMDARTVEIHYARHHKAYFTNLMKALEGTDAAGKSLETLFATISKRPDALRNNGGGHYNHDFFWKSLSPKGGGTPSGPLLDKITSTFGSFDKFKEVFKQSAMSRFGSGWAWLCLSADGTLFITSTANQENPLMDVVDKRGTPLLVIDVWEHAYYLKHQNLRASFVDAFWNIVNWPEVAKRLEQATKK